MLLKREDEGLKKAQPCRCGHQSAQRSKGKLLTSLLLSDKLNVAFPGRRGVALKTNNLVDADSRRAYYPLRPAGSLEKALIKVN